MIIKCCKTCSHYDNEMCMREEERPVGTAPDDWCLGWREKDGRDDNTAD
jgi:hypothetical protein